MYWFGAGFDDDRIAGLERTGFVFVNDLGFAGFFRESSVASSSTWACGRRGRCKAGLPLVPEAWPVHASLPLTDHPVPDIA
jgi:hypothetical protein